MSENIKDYIVCIEKITNLFDEHQDAISSFGNSVKRGDKMMIDMWEKKEAEVFKSLKTSMEEARQLVLDSAP